MAKGASDNDFSWLVDPIATGIELFGVAVILLTVAIATISYLLSLRTTDHGLAYREYRARLGRGILLGLELLVGADIVATVAAPLTWDSVGLLGLVVLIRTFLSLSLETEIEGRLPWQRAAHDQRA